MNILITSVGRRTYMVEYFKEALGAKGEIHAANSELTYAVQLADRYVITPAIYDTSYIRSLIEYCKKNDIKAIISLFDIDLPVLSKNRSAFDEIGVKLIVSDFKFVDICNDKWKTYQFLMANHFNAPKTFLSLKSAQDAVLAGEICFPLIVKPRWGMGSIGIFEADDETEMNVFYEKTKNTISKTYLKYESAAATEESVIIQEKIDGSEYGLDVFNDLDGNFMACVPKQKIAMRAGETDIARVIKSPEFVEIGKSLSRCTGHIANLDVDFFVGKDSKCYILELNCRFGGQYPFAHLAGVNFPAAIVEMLLKNKVLVSNLQHSEIYGYKDILIKQLQ